MNMNYQTKSKPTSINIDICKGKKFELKNLSRICNSKCKLDLNNNGNVTQQINNNNKKKAYPIIKTPLDQRNDFKKYVYAFVLHCITHSAPGPYHSNVDNYIYLVTYFCTLSLFRQPHRIATLTLSMWDNGEVNPMYWIINFIQWQCKQFT